MANNMVPNFIRELEPEPIINRFPTQMVIPIESIIENNSNRFSVLIAFPILWQSHSRAHKKSQVNKATNNVTMLQKIDMSAMLGRNLENVE